MTDSKCYAAIDIGSNAVRLLIKKVKNNENLANKRLSKVMLLRVPLRLGFDVFSLGEVSDAKVMKLRRLMKAFRQLMKIYEVTNYRACATSAMRDAQNGKSVIKKVWKDTGINIEVINGQEEARMIYNNHIECLEDRAGNYIYVDVGGGSTEINFLINGELVQSLSYNIAGAAHRAAAQVHEMPVVGQALLRRVLAHGRYGDAVGQGDLTQAKRLEQQTHGRTPGRSWNKAHT